MKIGRRNEPCGSFEVEFSEKFEEQMRKVAKEIVAFAKKDPAEAEKLVANYHEMIESSVSLLLSIISLAFSRPEILNYVFTRFGIALIRSKNTSRSAKLAFRGNRTGKIIKQVLTFNALIKAHGFFTLWAFLFHTSILKKWKRAELILCRPYGFFL